MTNLVVDGYTNELRAKFPSCLIEQTYCSGLFRDMFVVTVCCSTTSGWFEKVMLFDSDVTEEQFNIANEDIELFENGITKELVEG